MRSFLAACLRGALIGLLAAALVVAAPFWQRFVSAVTGRPLITTTALPDATVNQPYSFTFQATGGKPPYRWSPSAGLPGTLLLSRSGVLSGTLSAPAFIAVTVIDAKNKAASTSLPLRTCFSPAPLTIVTKTLPNGIVGVPYSAQLQATGGGPPTCSSP